MAKFTLNRRTMLRGLLGGSVVGIALPPLEAMLDANATAFADGSELPCRFMTWYWADGIAIPRWEPQQVGEQWELSEQLQPLAAVKDYVSVLSGLQNPNVPFVGGHHEGMTVFNGYNLVTGPPLQSDSGGPTIDQLIADTMDGETPVRAVHVQVSKRDSTDGDGGTTYLAMSHRGEPGNLVPQVPQINPRIVWQTLFGEFVPKPDDRELRGHILDAVAEDVARLRGRLGQRDSERLDAHLTAVDELRNKILATPPVCALPSEPTQENTDAGGREPLSEVNTIMAELIAHAFVCDITRVASFLFKRMVSATVFDEINVGAIHHDASHNPGSEQFHDGVVYQMQKFADLLQVFADTEDVDGGNLLDSTIIYASSDCSTPYTHSIERHPILLAGTGRGYLKHPGVHYQATPFGGNEDTPNAAGNTSDALLTCLRAFDPEAESVGGGPGRSTSTLGEVIA